MNKDKGALIVRKRPRTPRLIKIAVVSIFAFFAMSLIHLQVQIGQRQMRLGELCDEVGQQQATNDALRDQVENGVSDDYLAAIARQHGYIMPNERVFKDASSK